MVQIAQKFEQFPKLYRRPDGSRWGGQDLHDATCGVVTRSYVASLRKGRIENPGFEKLNAIAKAMGFPPELWFEDVENLGKFLATGLRGSWTETTNWYSSTRRWWRRCGTRPCAPCCAKSSACRSGREELCWGSCGSSKGRAGRFGERLEKGGVTPLPT